MSTRGKPRGGARESLRRTRLIAARELGERVSQRAYRIAVIVGALVAAAAVVGPTLIDDDTGSNAERVVVAFAGASPADADARFASLQAASRAVRGTPLAFSRAPSDAAVRKAVGDGDRSVGLILGGSATRPTVRVVSRQGGGGVVGDQAAQAVDLATQRTRVERLGAAADAAELLAPAAVTPEVVSGSGPTAAATAVVSVLGLLLYLAGLTLTQSYANGIVSDRTNRVTERLLTAARPFEHLAGKLIGVGAAGLGQFAVWIAAALAADALAGNGTALDKAPTALIVFFPVALVLTYTLYAAAVTILVLPVRKSEDVGGAVTPLAMLQVVSFILTTSIVAPGATVSGTLKVLSYVPFFSPLLMLGRLAGGDVPGWEVAIAVAGPLVLAAIFLRIAAPAYARYAIDAPGGKGLRAALALLRR